jgi:tetratricopeptide (TPR) repeat protein
MVLPILFKRAATRAALYGTFAALLFGAGAARADDYADVTRLIKAGQFADAQTKADQYLATKPRDPQMRFLKGVVQTEAGKANDAIATFTQITQEYPELPEPYNNLAVLYAGQSQFDKARAALEMAIRTNPSYATAHENLGDVYAKLASQAYSKALQLDGGNAAVQPKLALIRSLFVADSKTQGKPVVAAPVSVAPLPASAPVVTAKRAATLLVPATVPALLAPAPATPSLAKAVPATATLP